MCSSSPPPPPDPYQTANAQTQANQQTAAYNAALNRVNTYTPWGSLTYSQTQPGGTGGTQGAQPTFDQAGYDKAMAAWQASQGTGAPSGSGWPGGEPGYTGISGTGAGGGGAMPNKNDFMTGGAPGSGGSPGGGQPNWSATVTLSPEQQKLLDLQNQSGAKMGQTALDQLNRISDTLSHPVNFDGAPSQVTNVQGGQLQSSVGYGDPLKTGASYGSIQNDLDLSNVPKLVGGDQLAGDLATQRDSLYRQQAGYLDPQWQNQEHDLQNQLTQQGVLQNSDAWNRAVDDQARQKAFAYGQARDAAITGGGAEQSRLFGIGLAANQNAFGQDLASGQFHNAAQAQGFGQDYQNAQLFNSAQAQGFDQRYRNAQLNNSAEALQFGQDTSNANLQNQGRQQSISEILAQRNQPLNELNALRGGSQVTSPQFPGIPGANANSTDIASLIQQYYANQMGGYNSQQSQNNGILSGLFNLGGAGIMKYSDRRLKEDIKRVGTTDDGLPIYTYRYKGEATREMGVMAQEALAVKPEAVGADSAGRLMVDYGRI